MIGSIPQRHKIYDNVAVSQEVIDNEAWVAKMKTEGLDVSMMSNRRTLREYIMIGLREAQDNQIRSIPIVDLRSGKATP